MSASLPLFLLYAAEDTNLISGFDAPEGSEKVTEDEFDPIPVLISKNSQGKPGFGVQKGRKEGKHEHKLVLGQWCCSTWFKLQVLR